MQEHLQKRYLYDGNWETLVKRVSKVSSSVEKDNKDVWYEKFYSIMIDKSFIPAGNTLIAGMKTKNITYPNCAIIEPPTDNTLDAMIETSEKLWKCATGLGVNLSNVSDPLNAIFLLHKHNMSIDLNHRPRRGNMAVLSSSHPKIRNFITCKNEDPQKLSSFNISVAIENIDDLKMLLPLISSSAWKTGDPGLIFLEHISDPVSIPGLSSPTTCVPCGEQFMHPNETCNLGSINIAAKRFYVNNCKIDIKALKHVIRIATRLLDNIIDTLDHPTNDLKVTSRKFRRIGLGIMGWATSLKDIYNLSYNTFEARELAETISKILHDCSTETTKQLSIEKGSCIYDTRRNISVSCIAPTGGISLLANVSPSIEPYFEDAHNIHWKDHILMQASWQKYIDNAISKTINLHKDCTVEDIYNAYLLAYNLKCKGITVFRDGCRGNLQPIKIESCSVRGGNCD